mmetsp:Transcript_67404/g.200405  ORF Transcript_67404/g.200405 Transcript_67404/m.200405 type:complete len:203 (-) Transcript_67404:834-1442(-)
MDHLPGVLVRELALVGGPAHEPGVALRELARSSSAAPPPDAQASLAPEHHDAKFKRSLETHHRLVLGLPNEARLQGLQRHALVHPGLLVHVLGDVRLDVVNGRLDLLRLRLRQDNDTGGVAHVGRLHDHVRGARPGQVLADKVLDLPPLHGPLHREQRRHLRNAEVLQQPVQHELVTQRLDGALVSALLLHHCLQGPQIQVA